MNSFLAKIGWKTMRKGEIKIIVLFHSYPTRYRKFQKNRKKLKNTIVTSFQAKIGWKMMRKIKKIKIIVPFRSYQTSSRKFQKKQKKINKYHYGLISSQNMLENDEKDKKQKLSFCFVPTRRVAENSKKIKKIPLWLYFKPKQVGKYREGENIKSIVPFCSNPTRNRKFQKNSQKNSKKKVMASFQEKICWKRSRQRENKNYRFVLFLPNA